MKIRSIVFFAIASAMLTPACGSTKTPSDSGVPPVETNVGDQGVDAGDESLDSTTDSTVDSATDVSDTAVDDTGDTGVVDSGLIGDGDGGDGDDSKPPAVCSKVSDLDERDCGKCGRQKRICEKSDAGVLAWSEWFTCSGETGECVPGEKRTVPCGKCGTRVDTCDVYPTCTWVNGNCDGEGTCAPGDTEEEFGGCPVTDGGPTYTRRRFCNDKCAFSPLSPCLPPAGWNEIAPAPTTLSGREGHTAVWTGTDMIVWGGYGYCTSGYCDDGAKYRRSGDLWLPLEAAPLDARRDHTAVWTGKTMVIWGGTGAAKAADPPYYRNDGAAYDPIKKGWKALAASPLIARSNHVAVWSTTTNEMLVWGGYNPTEVVNYLSDGAKWAPSAEGGGPGTWTKMAAPPSSFAGRRNTAAVWDGTRMVVFAGEGDSTFFGDAAAYNPKTNTWATVDVSTAIDGRKSLGAAVGGSPPLAFFFGGAGTSTPGSYYRDDGITVPSGSTVSKPLAAPTALGDQSKRQNPLVWYGAGKFWIWGGYNSTFLNSGASYDPATGWVDLMPTSAATPTGRQLGTVVWTGWEAIVWGGTDTSGQVNTGAAFLP